MMGVRLVVAAQEERRMSPRSAAIGDRRVGDVARLGSAVSGLVGGLFMSWR
jgi:hypothetical protein